MISFIEYINERMLSESRGIVLYDDIKKIKKLYENIIYKIQPYLLTKPERVTDTVLIKNKSVEYTILKEPFIYTVDFNELGLSDLLKTKNFKLSLYVYDIECLHEKFVIDFFNANIEKFNNPAGFTSISKSDKVTDDILDKNDGQMRLVHLYSLFGLINKPYFYEVLFHEITHLYSQYKTLSKNNTRIYDLSSQNAILEKALNTQHFTELKYIVYMLLNDEKNAHLNGFFGELLGLHRTKDNLNMIKEKSDLFYKLNYIKIFDLPAIKQWSPERWCDLMFIFKQTEYNLNGLDIKRFINDSFNPNEEPLKYFKHEKFKNYFLALCKRRLRDYYNKVEKIIEVFYTEFFGVNK